MIEMKHLEGISFLVMLILTIMICFAGWRNSKR